jgi:hypothetical protein
VACGDVIGCRVLGSERGGIFLLAPNWHSMIGILPSDDFAMWIICKAVVHNVVDAIICYMSRLVGQLIHTVSEAFLLSTAGMSTIESQAQ